MTLLHFQAAVEPVLHHLYMNRASEERTAEVYGDTLTDVYISMVY